LKYLSRMGKLRWCITARPRRVPATTPNPSPPPQRGRPNENGWTPPAYLSIDLTNEQKERLKVWVTETEYIDMLKWLDDMIRVEHYLTIKTQKKAAYVALTGATFLSGHLNVCLTCRASTVEKALFGLMFRDTEITGGDWSRAQSVVDDY
jgi:hypothetical protein